MSDDATGSWANAARPRCCHHLRRLCTHVIFLSSFISFAALPPESPKLMLLLRSARAAGRRGSRRAADQPLLCLLLEQAGYLAL